MIDRIKQYNCQLYKQDFSDSLSGLFYGKMGQCIYWYLQGRFFKEEVYNNRADDILDKIYEERFRNTKFDFENGIIGVGLGLDALIEYGFVCGDRDEVLEDIDDIVIRQLSFEFLDTEIGTPYAMATFLWAGIYLTQRVEHGGTAYRNRAIMRRVLNEMMNKLGLMVVNKIPEEPILFAPFSYLTLVIYLFFVQLGKCNVCNEKLQRTITEWIENKGMIVPRSMGHRLLLQILLEEIDKVQQLNILSDYNRILKATSSLNAFVSDELRDADINLKDGVSILALFLLHFNRLTGDEKRLIRQKIENSYLWTFQGESRQKSFALFDGLMGAVSVYMLLVEINEQN